VSVRFALPDGVRRTDPAWLRALADLDLHALLGRAASQPRLAALFVADAQRLAEEFGRTAWPEVADIAHQLGVSETTARPYIAVAVAAGLIVLLVVSDDDPDDEPDGAPARLAPAPLPPAPGLAAAVDHDPAPALALAARQHERAVRLLHPTGEPRA